MGAAVCASGSQLCSGQAGALTASPIMIARAAVTWVVWLRPLPWAAASACMSKVPALVPTSRKPSSITAEPSSVYRMKRLAAGTFCPLPQRAIRKYIGISTISKARKKRIRSSAAKVASMPTSSSRNSPTNARTEGTPGPPGRRLAEYSAQSRVSSEVSTISGSEMPSTPRCSRTPMAGIQDTSVVACIRPGSSWSNPAASTTVSRKTTPVTALLKRSARRSAASGSAPNTGASVTAAPSSGSSRRAMRTAFIGGSKRVLRRAGREGRSGAWSSGYTATRTASRTTPASSALR